MAFGQPNSELPVLLCVCWLDQNISPTFLEQIVTLGYGICSIGTLSYNTFFISGFSAHSMTAVITKYEPEMAEAAMMIIHQASSARLRVFAIQEGPWIQVSLQNVTKCCFKVGMIAKICGEFTSSAYIEHWHFAHYCY